MARALCFVGAALLLVSCGRAAQPPPGGGPASVDRDSTHFIADVEDKCGVLPTCGFEDEDGCPDVAMNFASGSAALDADARKLLGQIAEELGVRTEIVSVEVIATFADEATRRVARARIAAVTMELIRLGVAATRIHAREQKRAGSPSAQVYFDVRCGGKSDRDKDGIVDALDRCPDEPEDMDGDADTDGCPETDPPATCTLPDGTPCMTE